MLDLQPNSTIEQAPKGCPFSDGFIATAHQFGHGVARQLNRVCLNGLLLGYAERKKLLDESDAKRAILGLGRNG